MPTPLEEELRAVQTSISQIRKEIDETDSKVQAEYLDNILRQYYEEEIRILKELNR